MINTTQTTLGEIAEARVEQTGPNGREFTYVDIGSIALDTKRIVEPKVLPVSKAPSRAKQVLKRGDVLVSMTRPNRNAVALVPPELDGAIGSTGFHVLRAKDAEPGFLFYAVQTNDFVDALCEKVQGALYPAVRPKDISSFRIHPFSLPQQRRISYSPRMIIWPSITPWIERKKRNSRAAHSSALNWWTASLASAR